MYRRVVAMLEKLQIRAKVAEVARTQQHNVARPFGGVFVFPGHH